VTRSLTTGDDTSDSSEPDDQGRGERSLRRTENVVLRVRNDGRDVALSTGNGQERAKVSDAELVGVREDGEPDDADEAAERDERRSEPGLVTEDGGDECVDGGKDIRRGTEQEGGLGAVSTASEDNGEEECDWVLEETCGVGSDTYKHTSRWSRT
jgi:hypothetical protein